MGDQKVQILTANQQIVGRLYLRPNNVAIANYCDITMIIKLI